MLTSEEDLPTASNSKEVCTATSLLEEVVGALRSGYTVRSYDEPYYRKIGYYFTTESCNKQLWVAIYIMNLKKTLGDMASVFGADIAQSMSNAAGRRNIISTLASRL